MPPAFHFHLNAPLENPEQCASTVARDSTRTLLASGSAVDWWITLALDGKVVLQSGQA